MLDFPRFMLVETTALVSLFVKYLLLLALLTLFKKVYPDGIQVSGIKLRVDSVHKFVTLFGVGIAIGFLAITMANSSVECKCPYGGAYNFTPYSLERIGFTQLLPPPSIIEAGCYNPQIPTRNISIVPTLFQQPKGT